MELTTKHTQTLQGYGIQLRPVTIEDAQFILELRALPHVIGNMPSLQITLEDECRWLNKNIKDTTDYLYIIQTPSGKKIGMYSIYNIDYIKKTAEGGRLIVVPGSFAALPACILALNFAFQTLLLDTITGWVVATNKAVINFNKQLGYTIAPPVFSDKQGCEIVPIILKKEDYQRRLPILTAIASKGINSQLA